MVTILGITRGGDRWAITDVAGIHITDGAHGAEPQSRMCTGCGATRRIRAPEQRGQIPIQAIMELRPVVGITTRRPAGAPSQDAVTTPTSTLATRPAIEAERRTTRILESWPVAARDMLATFTVARARRIAVASFTTPTRMQVSPRGRTTSMRARTALCTATTGRVATGRATVEVAGKQSTSRSQRCKTNRKCAAKEHRVPRTSVRCALPAVFEWAEVGGVRPKALGTNRPCCTSMRQKSAHAFTRPDSKTPCGAIPYQAEKLQPRSRRSSKRSVHAEGASLLEHP